MNQLKHPNAIFTLEKTAQKPSSKPKNFLLLPSVFCLLKLVFHETVLAIAQAEQRTPAKKKEDFLVPNELPQHPAHPNLIFRCDLVARVSDLS